MKDLFYTAVLLSGSATAEKRAGESQVLQNALIGGGIGAAGGDCSLTSGATAGSEIYSRVPGSAGY